MARGVSSQGTIEQTSFLAYTLALSLAVLGSDGILAVFVAGLAFEVAVSDTDRAEEEWV